MDSFSTKDYLLLELYLEFSFVFIVYNDDKTILKFLIQVILAFVISCKQKNTGLRDTLHFAELR